MLFLYKKRLSSKEISDGLVAILGSDATAGSTLARYVHDAKYTHPKVTSSPDMT
jgi:hypothetical protein